MFLIKARYYKSQVFIFINHFNPFPIQSPGRSFSVVGHVNFRTGHDNFSFAGIKLQLVPLGIVADGVDGTLQATGSVGLQISVVSDTYSSDMERTKRKTKDGAVEREETWIYVHFEVEVVFQYEVVLIFEVVFILEIIFILKVIFIFKVFFMLEFVFIFKVIFIFEVILIFEVVSILEVFFIFEFVFIFEVICIFEVVFIFDIFFTFEVVFIFVVLFIFEVIFILEVAFIFKVIWQP